MKAIRTLDDDRAAAPLPSVTPETGAPDRAERATFVPAMNVFTLAFNGHLEPEFRQRHTVQTLRRCAPDCYSASRSTRRSACSICGSLRRSATPSG